MPQMQLDFDGLLQLVANNGQDAPRTIRVFQKRMFLCENTPEILPNWATFVNGVINTPDLVPTAARDNFRRDDTFNRLRDRLGECIVHHFEQLRDSNPERLSEILSYHDLAIKSACHYEEPKPLGSRTLIEEHRTRHKSNDSERF